MSQGTQVAGRYAQKGILLLYHRPVHGRDALTVTEHIEAFRRFSGFPVCAVNTQLGFPPRLRRLSFPAIILHYSLFGSGQYPLGQAFVDYVDAARSSYKVAFFQDEYYFCPKRFAFINDHGIETIYTLLDPQHFNDVYGRYTRVTDIVPTLTGYVSEELVAAARRYARPDRERSIDVGYRGRELLPYMGRAAREKTTIAEEFKQRTAGLGLRLDIETKEFRRLYGADWFRFLGDCRASLGVEAGVSVFDLEGVVYERYNELRKEHPEASFDEMVQLLAPIMDPWEDRIYYRTISPRHFEAAVFRVCQVLFEGKYSGILEPGRHYIPLHKDFSNLDEVVEQLRDESARTRITAATFEDLITSGAFSYRGFVRAFDEHLRDCGIQTQLGPRPSARRAVRCSQWLCEHRPEAVLRVVAGRTAWSMYALANRLFALPVLGQRVLHPLFRPVIRPLAHWVRKKLSTPMT